MHIRDADRFRNDASSTSDARNPFDRAYTPKIMKAFTPVRLNELQTRIERITHTLLDRKRTVPEDDLTSALIESEDEGRPARARGAHGHRVPAPLRGT